MKASGSILCSLVAAAYLAAHLPFLAPSLEDIDSINFALGVRDFDIARHQPHPPGYPLYIAMGRASRSAIALLAPAMPQASAEALALAIWSTLAGALAITGAFALFRTIGRVPSAGLDRVSVWAAVLLAVAPLFWISGSRPMSDLPGLAIALCAQALTMRAWEHRASLAPAAFIAALAIGVRVQAVWLTLPLLLAVAVRHRQAGAVWLGTRLGGALAAGVFVWAIPLVIAAGGPAAYWQALGTQAGEDFAWVDMLWANPTPRRLAFALYETFVLPWGSVPLAMTIGALAMAGAAVAVIRDRRALVLVGVAFAPYALFHLLFQETPHVRYALPLLPAVTWLVAAAAASAGVRAGSAIAAAVCIFAAWTSVPATMAYARQGHPAFRAIADMEAVIRLKGDSTPSALERPAAVFAHYSLRRPLQAQPPAGVRVVEPPRSNEWVALVDYWRRGGTGPVWFLADPRRTDLAVIDPQSRRSAREYRWAVADRLEFSGTRPLGADWYRFDAPGWFVGEGWSLTPELGGMTRLAGNGVDRRPIEAYVLRRPDPMVAVVGARHLGTGAEGAIVFTLQIDGRPVDEWMLDPAAGPNTVRVLHFSAESLDGPGRYARLTIAARAVHPGRPTPPVAIRQFDIQPASHMVYAFDEGWHEEEYENATGRRWRWSSDRSIIRIVPPQSVRLTLRGESPLRYVDDPPTVRVAAGERVVAEAKHDDDFVWTVTVSDEDARASGGRIAIETDPVYLPGRAEGTSDERKLGLRLFEIAVIPSRRD